VEKVISGSPESVISLFMAITDHDSVVAQEKAIAFDKGKMVSVISPVWN